jgi:hypothetical protein
MKARRAHVGRGRAVATHTPAPHCTYGFTLDTVEDGAHGARPPARTAGRSLSRCLLIPSGSARRATGLVVFIHTRPRSA